MKEWGVGSRQFLVGGFVMAQRSNNWFSFCHVTIWCLLIALLAVGVARINTPPQRRVAGRFPTVPLPAITTSPLQTALERTIDVDVKNRPLREFIESLAAEQGIAVRFDEKAFLEEGVPPDVPISLRVKQLSLRNVLHLLLHPRELELVDEEGVLLVTSQLTADGILETHIYPLPDLYSKDSPGWKGGAVDIDSVIEVITTTVTADSWEEIGGSGLIREAGDGLLIRNTEAVHAGVIDLYRQIERLINRPGGSDYPAQPGETYSVSEAAIFQKLDEPIGVTFDDLPLFDAMRRLADRHSFNVWIDENSLRDEGISIGSELSFDYENVSLRSALRRMLDPQQLTFVVEDDVLKITTQIFAEESGRGRIYAMRRLVPGEDYDSIIELVTTVVSPDSWEISRPGRFTELPGLFCLSQMQHVHREIAQVLHDLEQIRTTPRQQRPAAPPLNRERRAEERIQQRLRKKIDVDVREQPLREVLQSLAKQNDIPLWIDEDGFGDEKNDPNVAVTLKLIDMPLETCLNVILKPHRLAAVYDSEHLRVTLEVHAEEMLVTRVYDIVDLLEGSAFGDPEEMRRHAIRQKKREAVLGEKPGEGYFQVPADEYYLKKEWKNLDAKEIKDIEKFTPSGIELALEAAVEMITESIQPKSWEEFGRPGTVSAFHDVLVIRQTEKVQAKIARLLAEMRSQP